MLKVLLAGNPNVGKSTLFNSITKSNEHTGNFHGVTVDANSKIVRMKNQDIEFVDLPGMYSLNSFSKEEEISKKILLQNDVNTLMVVDANSLRKNLYLCQQLNEIGINYKILINNYKYFEKNQNKIDLNKLKNKLNKEIYLINAKKFKLDDEFIVFSNINSNNNYKYLKKYVEIIQNKYKIDEKTIIFALNGIFFNLNEEQISFIQSFFPCIVKDRFDYIDNLIVECIKIKKDFVYGKSKLDKVILNPAVALLGFVVFFLSSFYAIFFLIGPLISSIEEKLLNVILINPLMNLLYMTTDNVWIIEFFRSGVLSSVVTVISFVPQVCLMFVFLTILEDSGIISRLAYVFDDFLNVFGLNGKALYIMLLGFGCNTMSTTTTRNMSDKNLKIRSAIINPYISCMARLPIYVLVASAFFGKMAFFVVAGLYLLGVLVALTVACILNKTFLKSTTDSFLLEFPPLKGVDIKHILQVGRKNSLDFFKRVFSVVLSVGVIVWILTHTRFNLTYTQNISESILFFFADKVAFLFAPIGLNSAGIVSALFVGILAKELIVSIVGICNSATSQKAIITSIASATSVIHFNIPSAISFLIFSLLYSPCASNLAVIKQETDKFYMWFSLISQLTVAYILSFAAYQALTKGIGFSILITIVIMLIMVAMIYSIKKVKQQKCLTCGRCNILK